MFQHVLDLCTYFEIVWWFLSVYLWEIIMEFSKSRQSRNNEETKSKLSINKNIVGPCFKDCFTSCMPKMVGIISKRINIEEYTKNIYKKSTCRIVASRKLIAVFLLSANTRRYFLIRSRISLILASHIRIYSYAYV